MTKHQILDWIREVTDDPGVNEPLDKEGAEVVLQGFHGFYVLHLSHTNEVKVHFFPGFEPTSNRQPTGFFYPRADWPQAMAANTISLLFPQAPRLEFSGGFMPTDSAATEVYRFVADSESVVYKSRPT